MVSNRANRRRANRGTPPICLSKKPDYMLPPAALVTLSPVWTEWGEGYYDIRGAFAINHPFYPCETVASVALWTDPNVFGPWSMTLKNFTPAQLSIGSTGAPYTVEVYAVITWPDGNTNYINAPCIWAWVPMMHYRPWLPPLGRPRMTGEFRLQPRSGPLPPPEKTQPPAP